jgi:hypothetical protein
MSKYTYHKSTATLAQLLVFISQSECVLLVNIWSMIHSNVRHTVQKFNLGPIIFPMPPLPLPPKNIIAALSFTEYNLAE